MRNSTIINAVKYFGVQSNILENRLLLSSFPTAVRYFSKDEGVDKENDKSNVTKSFPINSRPRTKAAARMQAMMLKREGRLNRPNITSTKDEQDGSVAQHDEYKITSIPTAKSFLEDGNRILYRRDQSKRFPQLLIGGTIIHSGYWFWYVTDFTNTLSDAGLQVSEHIGGLGFGFSVMMMAAATLYPRHLISEIIVASGGTGQVVVKLHTLPFARPENDGKIYARGDLSIGTEADKMKLEKNEGFKNQTGHMAIDASDKRLNILLDTSNADLIDEEGLTQMLLGRLVK